MDASMSQVPLLVLVGRFASPIDLILLTFVKIWQDWLFIRPYLQQLASHMDFTLIILCAKAAIIFFTLVQIPRYVMGLQVRRIGGNDFAAKPMLFPGRTAHTRFFPKRNHFSYPYLMVGVPVGWMGATGGMLSVDLPEKKSWLGKLFSLQPWSPWFTVNADDYLAREHVEGGLEQKLHDYLRSKGEDPAEFPYAYLLTPPRFFGYYSNPVSIWNLYSSSKILTGMILEVNNTFNERHNYFLKPDANVESSSLHAHPPRFLEHWPKDFHVSPFNSRAGSYGISASDPLYPSLGGPGVQNVTITLSSSGSHPKLVARVFSTTPAMDPAIMSVIEKTVFLAKWWWVGFATFPRTVQQAVNLMFKKGLRFISRPEPRANTLPRDADAIEHVIEPVFRHYLRTLVERCEEPFILRYIPAGLPETHGEMMLSPSAVDALREECEYLEIRVFTPLFYSRFVSYPKAKDAILSEYHESQTLSISNTGSLDTLNFSAFNTSKKFGSFDQMRLSLLKTLRRRPKPIVHEEAPTQEVGLPKSLPILQTPDIHSTQSDVDYFVISHSDPSEKREWTLKLTKLFLAEFLGWGSIEVLDLELFMLRCGLACFVAGYCLH